MEPVSFTVGVLGVASLFETCLNLYDKRFDAKDYPIDLAGLYLIYDIERIRFSELRNRLDFLTSSGHSPSMGGVDAAIAKDRGISEDALRDQCEDVIKHLRDITKRGEKIFERHSPRLGSGALSRASSPVSQGSQSSAAEEWNAPSTNGLGLTFSGCPQSSPGKLGSLRGEGPTPVSGGSLNVGLSIPGSRSSSSQSSPHAHSCPPISCETPIVIEPSPSKLSYAFVLKSSANGSHTYTADTRLKSKPKKKIWGILSWVASDKRRLSEVVSNMCQFNDKLAKLLPPEEKEVLDLSVLVSHLSTHSDERELKHLLEVGGSRYAYIQKTAKVKQLQLRLQSSSKDPALRSWKVDPQALIMVGPWGLNRVTASCKKSGRMVLIEFRDTFHLPDDDHTKRLDNLCDMLSAMSNTRNPGSPKENPIDFRTLECRGWIAINSRIGLVFNYPSSHSQKRSAQEIISLRDRIICTYRSLNAPPLGARFALAAGLAQALATMCAVDWVHRDLRGDNVIFFDNSSIAAPFLTGFAYARPGYQSISPTTTSTHGSISPAKKRTDNKRLGKNYSELYRWEGYAAEFNKLQREESPDHTENVMRFNISVDTYALGVVLLEIGLWRTVDFRSRDGPNDDVLISKAETLAHTVGEIYAGVVERCLVEGGAAAWRDRTLEDSKALLVEVVQKLSKCRA